jgi:HSP20 family protein
MPESDIYETEDHIYLIVNVAGVAKENMEVDFCNNVVRVAGVRSTMLPPGIPAQYHQLEMGQGDFERFFRIPAAVDDEDIEAVHGDGLLSIRMKKARRSRSVEVK